MPTPSEIYTLLVDTLEEFLMVGADCSALQESAERLIPSAQNDNLNALLNSPALSYRDAVLIQLAYALGTPGLDTTIRHSGARSVGGRLGKFLAERHVPAVADAYQNIGKNTVQLDRGNVLAFDSFLRWGKTASTEQLQACLRYACCRVANTARPVSPMPELDLAQLSFGAVMGLYTEMLETPSEGAHEQYIVACLLDALIRQNNLSQYRVETKRLNASDSSSRTAGDVQIMTGNRVLEAYEVTANDWRTKLGSVSQKLREHDLSRMHVVAGNGAQDYTGVVRELAGLAEDVSVIDLRQFCATVLSALTRNYRSTALIRLYQFLDRYGSNVERVNNFVRLLERRRLVAIVLPQQQSSQGAPEMSGQ